MVLTFHILNMSLKFLHRAPFIQRQFYNIKQLQYEKNNKFINHAKNNK